MPRRLPPPLLAILLLPLSACQSVYIVDDVDSTLSFDFIPDDELHGPYVQGAQVDFTVHTAFGDERMEGWRLVSSQPEVLAIGDQAVYAYADADGGTNASLEAEAYALSAGTVELSVIDGDGSAVHSREVTVGKPDRIELLYHGPLLIEWPPEEALTVDPWIVENGTGTFMLRYYSAGVELFGNDAVTFLAADSGAVDLDHRTTHWGKDRDWLSITPNAIGRTDFDIYVGGDLITSRSVIAVSADRIDNVSLLTESDADAQQGDELMVLAQAYASDGEPIYGVEYAWEMEGYLLYGMGDLLIYEFGAEEPQRTVSASVGSHSASAAIQSDGIPTIGSTNTLGCVAAEAQGAAAVVCLLLGLLLARRRRG